MEPAKVHPTVLAASSTRELDRMIFQSVSEMGLEVLKTEVVKPIHYFTVLFAGYNSKGNP